MLASGVTVIPCRRHPEFTQFCKRCPIRCWETSLPEAAKPKGPLVEKGKTRAGPGEWGVAG
jgi:hypothetical protein